ncbi:MAG: 1-acyl-sn-glycerol-3-phosphate acyltransferase, partial [Planctomycetes bacterium]|nr:1-acyl-sn-glycerol-3-phosphate acyltransferase [Planctomycetota bacterium]
WDDRRFILIDTGGLESKPEGPIREQVQEQADMAVADADVIIFLTDVTEGLTVNDLAAVERLRRSLKPVILAVNKVDNEAREFSTSEFYQLGLQEPLLISAYHNIGVYPLMDQVLALLPTPPEVAEDWDQDGGSESSDLKIAIIGRTNVGKSMLMNSILGQERSIVTPEAGTTRDAKAWQRRLAPADGAASFANGRLPAALMPVRWLVRGGMSLFMHSYVRVHVSGRENIPRKGAFILAPNHSSHLDSPATIHAMGGRRRVWVAGAQDYFFNTAIKRFLFGKIFDTISFDRKADGIRGLRRCGDALSRGDGLLIFPEGTRSITGEIQPFKIGVAVLAIERNVPIVPVHIHRTFDLLRKGQRIVRPGVAHVRFGAPIVPPNPDEIDDHYEAFRVLAAEVEQAVRGMRSEADAR